MSLDVILLSHNPVQRKSSGIFIREDGKTKEISREEWDERNPGHEPCIVDSAADTCEVFSANITHNLVSMAIEAGIYALLWHPETLGITKASQLIQPLGYGLALMKDDPDRFIPFSAKNGWGTYQQFIPWIEAYLNACKEYPDSLIETSV